MIEIWVSGRLLDLPENVDFEYSSENPLLTEAAGYTLGIDIPLKGSAVNSEVFGDVWLPEADIYSLRYPASIITPQIVLHGVVMIVGVSEGILTIQFLDGRSQQNSELSFEESYINELDLGWTRLPSARRSVSVDDAARRYGEMTEFGAADAVALPWVIKDSGEMIHNAVALKNNILTWYPAWFGKWNDRWTYQPQQENLSYMPFLLTVAYRVAEAMGYSYDFTKWALHPEKRNLLVCNTLPASLRLMDFSWAMPHWTVNEFFENIEYILEGEFVIDHNLKHISFDFTSDILSSLEPVCLDRVLDEFSIEVDISDDEDAVQSAMLKNVGYADNSSRLWPVLCCDDLVRRKLMEEANYDAATRSNDPGVGWSVKTQPTDFMRQRRMFSYASVKTLMQDLSVFKYATVYKGYPYDCIFYAEDVKAYFVMVTQEVVTVGADFNNKHPGDWEKYDLLGGKTYRLYNVQLLNVFGDFIVRDSDEADRIELKTVPVPVDSIGDVASAIFLPYTADEALEGAEPVALDPDDPDSFIQPSPYREAMSGEADRTEYYDRLYIGYWTGGLDWRNRIPITSNVHVYSDFAVSVTQSRSMRLNLDFSRGTESRLSMDEKRLYKFSFLSDSLPDSRAVFFIKGKRYICRKLTANFTSDGMKAVVSGEFYRF